MAAVVASTQPSDAAPAPNATPPPPVIQLEQYRFRKRHGAPPPRLRETDALTADHTNAVPESSTAEQPDSATLEDEATALFASAREQLFEDGMESDFSRGLEGFVITYGRLAMEAVIQVVLSNRADSEVVSEALRVVGRISHEPTYRDRLWLLERGLYSESARVRDGATLGLSYLDDPAAITPLTFAAQREPLFELRRDMEEVVAQLQETARWRSV